jgi:hypothetical protein
LSTETLTNVLLGPFYDLKRFTVGVVTPPPPSRIIADEKLAAAREELTQAGCDLSHCTETNLHTWPSQLPSKQIFDLFRVWQVWPRSAFFACPRTDNQGDDWFSYRWYRIIPIVKMKLKAVTNPHLIIYDIVSGVGVGGYHSFLFDPADSQTNVSILTTFPPHPLFFEGLHDQVNRDIYTKLQTFEETP